MRKLTLNERLTLHAGLGFLEGAAGVVLTVLGAWCLYESGQTFGTVKSCGAILKSTQSDKVVK